MAGRLIKICLFLLALFIGDRLIAARLDQVVLNSQFRFSRMYKGECDADIVIVGNSRGVAGFYSPAIEERFGVRCLNLSYNGMSPSIARAVIEDYLEHNESPRLIIVEATCVDSQEGDILNLKPFWHHSPRLSLIAKNEQSTAARAAQTSHLFAYNCEILFRILHYRNKSDQTWIRRTTIDAALLRETEEMPLIELELPTDEELADLRAIAELCTKREIECRMVIAPYLPGFRRKIENWDQWKAAFSAADSGTGDIQLVDLSAAVLDDQYFADRLHPNFAGRNAMIDAAIDEGVFQQWPQ